MEELGLPSNQRIPLNRIRKSGDGRKQLISKDISLHEDLKAIIESSTLGDLEVPILWCSSRRKIAASLNSVSHPVSHNTVANLLKNLGYSLQSNRKVSEGLSHADRDAQFTFINDKVKHFQSEDQPVISVDTKKKENIGNFKNGGKEYASKGNSCKVSVHDFIDKFKGKASPYGIYDITNNNGWVSVGLSSDTAQFSVNSIRSWWHEVGKKHY